MENDESRNALEPQGRSTQTEARQAQEETIDWGEEAVQYSNGWAERGKLNWVVDNRFIASLLACDKGKTGFLDAAPSVNHSTRDRPLPTLDCDAATVDRVTLPEVCRSGYDSEMRCGENTSKEHTQLVRGEPWAQRQA